MAMSIIWSALVLCSVLCGAATGQLAAVSAGAMEGAQAAVELCVGMAGALCLWSGVMEVLRRCGALESLRRLLTPALGRLFPAAARDGETMDLLAANVSASLLGLGNAATPLGVRAAERMARGSGGRASDDLCRFVVCNTASLQLVPTTVAAVRSAAGCETPFDILPAVWLTSALALAAGLTACAVLARLWGD